jgi:hypothetical protein
MRISIEELSKVIKAIEARIGAAIRNKCDDRLPPLEKDCHTLSSLLNNSNPIKITDEILEIINRYNIPVEFIEEEQKESSLSKARVCDIFARLNLARGGTKSHTLEDKEDLRERMDKIIQFFLNCKQEIDVPKNLLS